MKEEIMKDKILEYERKLYKNLKKQRINTE